MEDFTTLGIFIAEKLFGLSDSMVELIKADPSDVKAFVNILDDVSSLHSYAMKKALEIVGETKLME